MITRVIDTDGRVVHDCKDAGCTTSWDGYEIATGAAVENRQDPDPKLWRVKGDTARQVVRPG